MVIFIDVSVFCALANADDVHHKKAKKIIEDVALAKYGKGITTDYIFDETVTVALRRSNKKIAVELGKSILNSEILLARIGNVVFRRAWELFQHSEVLSFTDNTSVAFMQLFGIKKIATFDKGFKAVDGIEVIDGSENH